MGRLLDALLSDSGTVPAANPAKVANLVPSRVQRFADSQDSQALRNKNPSDDAERLLAAIRAQCLPDDLIGLHDAAPGELGALPDEVIAAYVRALRDTDLRRRGKVPSDETAAGLCRHCGPVWIHPAIAEAAPKIDGMPYLLGCPWCHIPKDGVLAMPRPPVKCGSCLHFERDPVNPEAGAGRCGAGVDPARPYPSAKQLCGLWRGVSAKDGH